MSNVRLTARLPHGSDAAPTANACSARAWRPWMAGFFVICIAVAAITRSPAAGNPWRRPPKLFECRFRFERATSEKGHAARYFDKRIAKYVDGRRIAHVRHGVSIARAAAACTRERNNGATVSFGIRPHGDNGLARNPSDQGTRHAVRFR
ncbi:MULTISPECIES: hypothetical protein [Burkholderia]|uniref:hypothetical protein n=1 Tax=Burkholderia TaxID=32008 RepID=UPI00076D405B|nr:MULTISPECIES: hypothetical protein [Burkholderia]KVG78359.1 hypothetical protein WS81_15565 [Burkholderia sp. MSMB2040]